MRAAILPLLGVLSAACAAHVPSADSPPVASGDGSATPTAPAPGASVHCTSIRPAGRPAPSFEELRALLGRPRDAPEVAALRAKLGTPTVGNDAHGGIAEEFREAGVTWSFLDRAHLSSISLDGRVGASARYAQALPHGLAFTMSKAEVSRTLPATRACDLGLPCDQTYPEKGLALTYEGGRECLARVELFTPVASDEVRIEAMSTRSTTTDGETGALVSFLVRRGATEPRVVDGHLALATKDGAPVAARAVAPRAPSTKLAIRQRQDHRGPVSAVTFFVPYRDANLTAGAHDLVAEVAVDDVGAITYGPPALATAPPRPLRVTTSDASLLRVALKMPPVRTVRVGVQSAEVAEGVYDDVTRTEILAAIGTGGASLALVPPPLVEKHRARLSKPDLVFFLGIGVRQHFRSSARQDTFSATWNETSPPFFAADGDVIFVCIGDEDFTPFGTKDERIGCVRGTTAELETRSKAGRLSGEERLKSAALRITITPP